MDASMFFRYDPDAAAPDEIVFLEGCTDDDWRAIVQHGERRSFRAGDVVIAQGDSDRSMLIVLEGQLQTVVGTGRKQRRLSAAPSGSVIGELGFIDGRPRSATVVADRDGELLRLDFDAFEALAAVRPQLAHRMLLDLARILSMRLRRVTDVVAAGRH